jgi:surfeit locus 1 family protein
MRTREIQLGKLRIRFHWGVALAVLLTASGFLRLGLWQLDRAGEKIEQQESFEASGQSSATPLERVPVAGLQFDLLQHQNRRVRLEGSYLNEQPILLIYQSWEEQLGYEVLTPFLLQDGSQIALVSRGWSGITDTAALLRSLLVLEGQRSVEGQLYVPSEKEAARRNDSRNTNWPLLRRYVDAAELQAFFEQPLFPYVVRLAENQEGVLIRHWPEVMVDTSRHFSYALQWFALAIAVLTVALILGSNIRQLGRKPEP